MWEMPRTFLGRKVLRRRKKIEREASTAAAADKPGEAVPAGSHGRASVPQHLPGMGVRLLVVLDRHFTVHRQVAIAFGALHVAPLVAGQIVCAFLRQYAQFLEVVDPDIGGRAFDERAAIAEAGAARGHRAQLPMRFFERQDLIFAEQALQRHGRVAALGQGGARDASARTG
jgi:hypothetical protein